MLSFLSNLLSSLLRVVGIVLLVSFLGWILVSYQITKLFYPSYWLAFLLGCGFFAGFLYLMGKSKADNVVLLFLIWLTVPILCVLVLALDYLRLLALHFIQAIPDNSIRSIGILTVIVVGTLLFWIRLKFRIFYGLTEIAFGCYIAWDRLPEINVRSFFGKPLQIGEANALAIGLISGSVYLLVRGLDNAHVGYKQRKEVITELASEAASLSHRNNH
jgi:hypothetical protein